MSNQKKRDLIASAHRLSRRLASVSSRLAVGILRSVTLLGVKKKTGVVVTRLPLGSLVPCAGFFLNCRACMCACVFLTNVSSG